MKLTKKEKKKEEYGKCTINGAANQMIDIGL